LFSHGVPEKKKRKRKKKRGNFPFRDEFELLAIFGRALRSSLERAFLVGRENILQKMLLAVVEFASHAHIQSSGSASPLRRMRKPLYAK